MSIISFLGGIVGAVGKALGVVGSVIKVARPLVVALRPAVKEIDIAMDFLEDIATKAGTEADDFLDKNLPVINAIETVSARGVVFFGELNAIAVNLRKFSQEQTPNKITEGEAKILIGQFARLKDLGAAWGPELDDALAKMDAVEEG